MGSWSRAGYPTTIPDGMDDIPELHTIKVRDRRIQVDYPTLVQNNVKTDTVTLDLDGEWDGLQVVINLGECGKGAELAWYGSPVTIPASLMAQIGSLPASVVGYSSDGTVRLVTAAANTAFSVVSSGCVEQSEPPEDPTSIMGQLLEAAENANEAAESADTAATSASSAATAATTAAQSANAAATSATTAASAATSAASSANSAASAANAAASAASQAAESATGNVLRGEVAETDVASAGDAWGRAPLGLRAFGNTRQNLWANPNKTFNGITVTSNEDGSMTLSGTSTYPKTGINVESFVLKPSTTYTARIDTQVAFEGVGSCLFQVLEIGSDDSQLAFRNITESGVTFTTNAGLVSAKMNLYVSVAGITPSGTYRVMLNEGSEAEPWCPPGIHSVGELMDHEKNLWVNPSGMIGGQTCTPNDDGSFTISGVGSGTADNIDSEHIALTPGKTYTLSVDKERTDLDGNARGTIAVREYNSSGGQIAYNRTGGKASLSTTFTANSNTAYATCSVIAGENQSTGTYRVMLNEGSTAMPWVPPGTESAVQVVTAGKNLVGLAPTPGYPKTSHGITAVRNDDGSITLSGTATAKVDLPVCCLSDYADGAVDVPEGTYTVSGGSTDVNVVAWFYDIRTNVLMHSARSPQLDTEASTAVIGQNEKVSVYLSINQGTTVDATVYPQLEFGDEATDYEPPSVATTPIPLDGNELCSLPDGTRDELRVGADGSASVVKRTASQTVAGSDLVNYQTNSKYPTISNIHILEIDSCGSDYWRIDGVGIGDVLPPEDRPWNKSAVGFCGNISTYPKAFYVNAPGATSATDWDSCRQWLDDNPLTFVYKTAEDRTIPLDAVTLPPLSPTWSMWVQPNANGVPATLEVEYEKDVNAVIGSLEERVAALESAQ